ncbi:hypothetical protein PRIPAC_73480 [Pristionchus pacificus]|uniref:Uncharacterized protein n=1 Tax=Pristionchus pacificus TaxID=54126 RepID=A0A454XX44_PRIPA|nr:hypothetical protein PRIPAC_73480 [Pristionchus pacificus]|eukprot:PDM81213.1 hypothetical protein PRIPAC_36216 [Pristionchus pacificus]
MAHGGRGSIADDKFDDCRHLDTYSSGATPRFFKSHMRVIGPSRSRFDSVARALVTPLIDPFEFDADENEDPTNMNSPPMDVPIMPVLTNKLKSMKMIR